MRRYGLYGTISRDFLTWRGLILVHDNASELEWMCPKGTAVVRELPKDIPHEQTMDILYHPNFEGVKRPITKEQFR